MTAPAIDSNGDLVTTWAGYRAHTRARSTGTLVVLVDNLEAGLDDPTESRWWLVCDDHAGCCSWEVQADARRFMSAPDEWCPDCQENAKELADLAEAILAEYRMPRS